MTLRNTIPDKRRLFGLMMLACLFLQTSAAAAAELSPAQLVNLSGRQRMLTQRIVKAYIQIGLGITPDLSRRQLNDSLTVFEGQLARLKRSVTDSQGRKSLAHMESQWRRFRQLVAGKVHHDNAVSLMSMSDELLGTAHELTLALRSRSPVPAARLVNIAGRQRMLSQRMAKYYLARAWGVVSVADGRELGSAQMEFDGALITLRNAPENTVQIRKELDAVAAQWEWFKNALALEGAESYSLVVVHSSEAILNSMELVTALYEKLQ